MEDLATASVLVGTSQQPFCRPAPERRIRKTGTANIFQGVNLRQLRRLFRAAGEEDPEHRARLVWGGDGGGERKGEEERDEEEIEIGLAQALVGLRVRARTRSGIRAEGHRSVAAGTRRDRDAEYYRNIEGYPGQPDDIINDDDDGDDTGAELGACGGMDNVDFGSGDHEPAPLLDEGVRGACSGPLLGRNGIPEKDPERYLHRIHH
ncbi:uncharacterized protein avpi1 [Chanos chanos]|uniref:Arginine vasopressin-induced protein 1 n=1 Tax=Chanos chanos TaxID=29144 RepID=A0A6J2VWD7_CHACN|nr:uncharacterized protein LOC115817138 [Chanos chanos]